MNAIVALALMVLAIAVVLGLFLHSLTWDRR